ncbi:MAG TPA: phosphatidate cytidylyltransferase [Bacteroidia bacterium]
MAFNVKTFYTRATTALVFVALLLGCVWYSYYSFVAFFLFVALIGLYEFYKLRLQIKLNKLIGVAYVLIPCVLLVIMAFDQQKTFQPQKVLGMIFFIWINDTGAYLVGSFIGKHKLYEKISPNKTWEGTIGGIALCIALSFVVANMFPQLAIIHWVAISVIVAVFGTLGDLVESMLKRMAGVKDSGTIMPGHGGVLDRFDSLFFATPFVFCYLALMGLL